MHEDDLRLLRRYVETGAQDAFAHLVRQHMDAVYSAALRRVGGDIHLARDVAQDVFVALARHASGLIRHEYLGGWLQVAARNAAANRVRGEIRRRKREREAVAMNEGAWKADEMSWDRLAPVLDQAIDELPENDRRALWLRYFEQRPFAEIGAVLRVTDDAARMRVDRALTRLHTVLGRRGIRSSAAALGAAMSVHAVGAAPAGFAAVASEVALATPVTAWMRLADFAVSFHAVEVTVLAAALLTLGAGAIALREADRAAALATQTRIQQTEAHERLENQRELLIHQEAAVRGHRSSRAQGGNRSSELSASRSSSQGGSLAPTLPRSEGLLAGGRRTELGAMYDAFYRGQGWEAGEIERFEEILTQGSESFLWVFNLSAETPPARRVENREPALRELLGERGYATFREYNRLLPARELAMQLASEIYLSEPLSLAQAERLTQSVVAASEAYRSGGRINLDALDWNLVMNAAAGGLSHGQHEALLRVRQRLVAQSALRERQTKQTEVDR